jgi:hypothetical protein
MTVAGATPASEVTVPADLLGPDHTLHRGFAIRGGRRVLIYGVAPLNAGLRVATRGNSDSVLPLFAVGVFTTLARARAGMFRRRVMAYDSGWRW